MERFGVVLDGVVVNVIVADSKEIVVNLLASLGHTYDDVIKESNSTKPIGMGYGLVDGKFRLPKPNDKYKWDSESWSWSPIEPVPDDSGDYSWDFDEHLWKKP